jgi:hypothetical protein
VNRRRSCNGIGQLSCGCSSHPRSAHTTDTNSLEQPRTKSRAAARPPEARARAVKKKKKKKKKKKRGRARGAFADIGKTLNVVGRRRCRCWYETVLVAKTTKKNRILSLFPLTYGVPTGSDHLQHYTAALLVLHVVCGRRSQRLKHGCTRAEIKGLGEAC